MREPCGVEVVGGFRTLIEMSGNLFMIRLIQKGAALGQHSDLQRLSGGSCTGPAEHPDVPLAVFPAPCTPLPSPSLSQNDLKKRLVQRPSVPSCFSESFPHSFGGT